MTWPTTGADSSTCTMPVAIDGESVGTLRITIKRSVPRNWKFKLSLRREEVLSWHFTQHAGRHTNPPACGPGFKPKVHGRQQEHCWSPVVGRCRCARELPPRLDAIDDLRDALGAFCDRARIDFEPPFSPPATGEQGVLLL
ncbi:MAG: hypothetical protein M3N47_02695 [Chloroflexota bacterium]|nr:hypothetical protein [Chloroflexota bacterium]